MKTLIKPMSQNELRNKVTSIRSKLGALANEALAIKVNGYKSPIDTGALEEMFEAVNSWEEELSAEATKVEINSGSIISFNDSVESTCKRDVSWNNRNFLKFFGL